MSDVRVEYFAVQDCICAPGEGGGEEGTGTERKRERVGEGEGWRRDLIIDSR